MRWSFASPREDSPPAPEPVPAGERRYPSWDLEEGALIVEGRRALARVGGGSRYEVYLAWDEGLFALVVAKVLRPGSAEDPRALRELRREAAVLERLAHPGLVRGFGATLDGPRPHLVLEHVEGPSLHRLIHRHGALSLQQLLPVALQLAGVLRYLASQRVVHLDVKPGNVVLGVPPRLVDLSIARSTEGAARLRSAIGTDAYMAPEQCAPGGGAGRVGTPADVWGLGATLYHAAAGRVPFPREPGAGGSSDPAVRWPQIARGPEAPPPDLPPQLSALLLGMLARDPAARPTAEEVAGELEPLVAQTPVRPRLTRRGLPYS